MDKIENNEDTDTGNTPWVFLNDISDITNCQENYYLDCAEPVQELNVSDLSKHKSDLDSESDGISVISDNGDNEDMSKQDEVKEENIPFESKFLQSKKNITPENNYNLIGRWVLAILLLILSIGITKFFDINNASTHIDNVYIKLSTVNDLKSLKDIQDLDENHVNMMSNPVEGLENEYNMNNVQFENKIFIKHKATKYWKSADTNMEDHENWRNNVIKKDTLKKHGKQKNKFKNHKNTEKMYTNKIVKEREDDDNKWRKRKGRAINDREKELELEEQFLKRKENFLLNKEYKLLQKEMELNKIKIKHIKEKKSKNVHLKQEQIDEFKNKPYQEFKDSEKEFDKKKKVKQYKKPDKCYIKEHKREIKNVGGKKNFPDNDWYNKLHNSREQLRKVNSYNWLFERAKNRKKNRNKARWYFEWMEDRETLRFKKNV